MGAFDYDSDEILTLKQAAQLLHIHPETVRRWHLKEGLPVLKFGNTLRIRKDDLLDFLKRK